MHITIQHCNKLQNIPYDKFWGTINQVKTPIIEPDENDPNFSLVTFLYKANKDTKNVILATYGLCSYDPKQDQLTHYPGTDIFYKTYRFPTNLKTIYCFSPNDCMINMADSDLYQCDLSSMVEKWQPDAFNPNSYTLPGWLILGEQEKKFSLLKLPEAKDNQWAQQSDVTKGVVSYHEIKGKSFTRTLSIYKSGQDVPDNYQYPLITFFDGDAYQQFCNAMTILDNLIEKKLIPPVIAAFISNPPPNTVTRWNDLTCNEHYTDYIGKELIPWIHAHFPTSTKATSNFIVGASFGGLAGMFLGLRYPNVVGNIISQSGAFFWFPREAREDGWLMKQFATSRKLDLNIYLDVGCVENALTFNKGASILSTNRHLRDVLMAKEYQVFYQEYAGGHDYMCWQDTLPTALIELFKNNAIQ